MIIVHIPCDVNARPYAEYAFNAMHKLAHESTQLRLQYHDVNINAYVGFAGQSAAHGSAVGEAFRSIEDSSNDLHIICDSDTVVIQPEWDVTIRHFLQSVDCVGVAYETFNEHSHINAYQNKPNVAWLALRPGKPWYRFEPRPPFRDTLCVNSEDDSRLWGLPVGQTLHCDTCWNFPLFLRDHQLTSLAFKNIAPRRRALTGTKAPHDEFELSDGTSFVVHQRRSASSRFREADYSREFYDCCDALLTGAVREHRVLSSVS